MLEASGISDQKTFVVRENDAIKGLAKTFGATDLETIKAYMIANYVGSMAAYLPAKIDNARFDFYGKALRGTEVQQERWKRAVNQIDDQGRKTDGNGVQRDWWSEEDGKAFEALSGALADQYSEFEPLPGLKLNGKLTLGENIGDLTGITMGYAAYKRSLNGKEAPIIDGMTGDQRFFLAYGSSVKKRCARKLKTGRIALVNIAPMASYATSMHGARN